MNNQAFAKPERIQKIISAYGAASRRNAEKMIIDGRVFINGVRAVIGQSAVFGVDIVSIDGVALSKKDEYVYIMLNKPRGYLTTVNDDRGRRTVMELLTDVSSRVYPVGRLDLNSEGLLIFTNDGEFANAVMHPSYNKLKTYEVEVQGDIKNALDLLKQPIKISTHTVHAENVEIIKHSGERGFIRISIVEGRNRQVRKMCVSCGLSVKSLRRISIGSLKLGDLKIGNWRYLTKEEVSALG